MEYFSVSCMREKQNFILGRRDLFVYIDTGYTASSIEFSIPNLVDMHSIGRLILSSRGENEFEINPPHPSLIESVLVSMKRIIYSIYSGISWLARINFDAQTRSRCGVIRMMHAVSPMGIVWVS